MSSNIYQIRNQLTLKHTSHTGGGSIFSSVQLLLAKLYNIYDINIKAAHQIQAQCLHKRIFFISETPGRQKNIVLHKVSNIYVFIAF